MTDLKVQVKDENRMSLLTWKKPKDGGKIDTYKVEYTADDRKFKPVSVCVCVHARVRACMYILRVCACVICIRAQKNIRIFGLTFVLPLFGILK